MKLWITLSVFVSSLSALAYDLPIYGVDNRKDVYETSNRSYLELAKSTAAMINNDSLTLKKSSTGNKFYQIEIYSLKDVWALCPSERFLKQPTAAKCSGFLISPTKLVTAGHCISSNSDCKKLKWVFDYKMASANQTEFKVPVESVYTCTKVLAQEYNNETKSDFALVELDRPVTGRRPLKFRQYGKAAVGDELVVIGHPSGLPTKIADGAKVLSTENKYFLANLDSFSGNSGSAVFNVKTEEVEGILVRGARDYIPVYEKKCFVARKCGDGECKGEASSYITNVPGLNKL